MEWWTQDSGGGKCQFVLDLFADDKATVVEAKLSEKGLQPEHCNVPGDSGKFVYAVLAKSPIERVHGESHVLYIGQGNAGRMKALLENRHSATRAVRHISALGKFNGKPVQLVWRAIKQDERVSTDPRLIEAFLLHEVAAKHGELPPANLRWEGFFGGELLKAMMQHVHGEKLRGLRAYDWPADLGNTHPGEKVADASTWCDYRDLSLGWLWPETWTESATTLDGKVSGQLVLATRKNKDAKWDPQEEASCPLKSLGIIDDLSGLVSEWKAVDDESTGLEGEPVAKLKAWLSNIVPTT